MLCSVPALCKLNVGHSIFGPQGEMHALVSVILAC